MTVLLVFVFAPIGRFLFSGEHLLNIIERLAFGLGNDEEDKHRSENRQPGEEPESLTVP